MATGGKLEVQIGADKTDFDKKIKEVEFDIKELSRAKLDKIKLGLDTREITAQIKDAKNSLNGLKTAVRDTGGTIGGMAPKVANGSNALMQFSRIAQDAPYGIIGIGNNITATVEAFGHLKNSTGTAGGALKAMASSLMGTGGILLGVSLLTTGFTLLAQSGLSIGDIIDKVTGKFDAFGQSVNKMAVDAAKNSGQEIANIKALVSVAQDELKSRKDRLLAVDELQSKYPAYFGNLSNEKILTGDLTTVTKELAKAIIARAEASAIADKIGELASKKLELQIKREKEIVELQKAQISNKNKIVATGGTMGATGGASGLSEEFRLSKATSTVKDLNQQIYDVQLQQDKLAGRLNQKTSDSIKLLEKKATVTKAQTAKPEKTFNFREAPTSQTGAGLFGASMEIPAINGEKAIQSLKDFNLRAGTEFTLFMKLAEAFNEEFSGLVEGNLNSSLSNLGESIGQALASGQNVFSAIGNSLLQSLGSFLSDMGGLLIKYGILAVAKGKLDLAIATGGPISIAAGLAAIGVGVLLKAAGGAIGSKAQGGQTSTATGQGANNTSTTSGGGTGWSGGANGTVVFEIAGTSLIGVLNNTTERNLRIGGR